MFSTKSPPLNDVRPDHDLDSEQARSNGGYRQMPGRPYRSSGKDLQFRSDKPFKIAIAVAFISAIVWFGHHHSHPHDYDAALHDADRHL